MKLADWPTAFQRKPRVLVVEDNSDSQELMAGILNRLGVDSIAASDASFAIKAIKAAPFDLVLLDCQLPLVDGFTLARQIRNESWGKSLIIVGLSGYDEAEARPLALNAGMNDYLGKPVVLAGVQQLLEQWFDKIPGLAGRLESPTRPSQENVRPVLAAGRMVVNPKAVALLRSLKLEETTLFDRQVKGFLKSTPGRIALIGEALRAQTLTPICDEAHRLKTLCGIVGADRMVDVCDALQRTRTKSAPWDEVGQYVAALESEWESAAIELQRLLAEGP